MADQLSAEKQTLMALRALRQRVEELEGRGREPIAIVGMACRFPGGADSPENYWDLLQQRRNAVNEIPRERMDLDPVFDSRPQTPGKTYSRWAGLLDKPGDFDAEFFGISPREAVTMDPQQRLLLEVSWEALENAGINPKSLTGQNAGVFVGITASEYAQLQQRNIPRHQLTAYVLQGSALNATAGRLSYFYGLNGPSMAIDTACSSSLVAVDRACRSLREGESQLAIAAGVNVLAVPESLIIVSQWGMLSPSGKVRAFSSGADGFVRGEGCGVLLLKRLSEAERAGDRILAVILGSAVNQDGASSGLTVPNGLAQQALLREAHRRAGIEAVQVGYVEAHGTGTELGDPIEAEALGAVFGAAPREDKLLIGSVKTNVGHLESAAGVAGLIKVVLGLEHGVVPAQLHWEQPSEHVRWSELPLEVVTESREWLPIGGRRIGGVSSFGFSGTNAHVVVEGWEQPTQILDAGPREGVLVVTARTEAALRALAERYAEFLSQSESGRESDWSEICYTAAVGRAVFGERLAVLAESKAAAAAKLRQWLRGGSAAGVYAGQVRAGERARKSVSGTVTEMAAEFVRGATVDWASHWSGRKLGRVSLPTYAFQRERYWIEASAAQEVASGEATGRSFLGRRLRTAGVRGQYETKLSAGSWIGEHVVEGRAVLPATGHLELMLEAGAEVLGTEVSGSGWVLEDVVLESRLEIAGERQVQTVVEEERDGRSRVRVYGEQAGGKWERVSEGWLVGSEAAEQQPEKLNLEALRERLEPRGTGDELYRQLASRGLEFGERFRGVERVWGGEGEALGEIAARGEEEAGWELRPWWLDACLQVAGLAAGGDDDGALYLPLSVDRLEIYGRPAGHSSQHSWSYVTTRRIHADTLAAEVTVTSPDGSPLLRIHNLRFRKSAQNAVRTAIYGVEWIEATQETAVELNGHWVVLAGENEFGEEISNELRRRGATCSLVQSINDVTEINTYYLPANSLAASDRLARTREALCGLERSHGPLEGVLDLRAAGAWDLSMPPRMTGEPQDMPGPNASLSLLQALLLEQIHPSRGVWLITRNSEAFADPSPSAAGRILQALRRTAMLEFPELAVHSLDLDAKADVGDVSRALALGLEEMMVRGERICVPRLVEQNVTASEKNTDLIPAESGLIEDLNYVAVEREAPQKGEVEIAVEVSGVNFRDVMNSLGMLPNALAGLGGECAGIVRTAGTLSGFTPGERVVAFARRSYRKFVTVTASNVVRVPDNMSLAQAAGLPVVYLTALHGLDRLAALQPGERVLIHSAAGGLGLAAVHVARARRAEIFATAGSEEKRAYLRLLGIQHVLPSRTVDFAEEVMRLSGGSGVDVVLNSLTGVLAEKTLSVLAYGGRFLEVGKRDTLSLEFVRQMRPDVSHFVFDFGEEATRDASLVASLLQETLQSIATGALAPLPVTEFTDAKEALRYMVQARHIGKIVVKQEHRAAGLLNPDPDATYLITGGWGDLGLLFAHALVERGARHLILMGRKAPGAAASEAIQQMRSRGVNVKVVSCDVADRGAVESALAAIPASQPLNGILHAAGVIEDHSLLEQNPESISTVLRPKWSGAWNLHTLTRDQKLDFFVLFSSAAALLGSPGQANYAAANASLDALAEYRRSLGLPALSVQWGPWAGAGMAANLKNDPESTGLGRIDPDVGIKAVESLLIGQDAVAAVLPVSSWKRFVSQRPAGTSALFSLLTDTNARHVGADASQPKQRQRFLEMIRDVTAGERREMLREHLRSQTVHILSLPAQTRIDEDEALHDLGLDSLMAVELRNSLAASLDMQLPPTMVLDYPTLRTLTDFLLAEMFDDRRAASSDERVPFEIEAISEDEAESLLQEELGRREHGARR
jgi:3-oxoacyl-(acyl-carrier-protein) synthase/NADPH:quinone reductase-like Zn-dependent oxidoreductase/acyl carrier protein